MRFLQRVKRRKSTVQALAGPWVNVERPSHEGFQAAWTGKPTEPEIGYGNGGYKDDQADIAENIAPWKKVEQLVRQGSRKVDCNDTKEEREGLRSTPLQFA
jgi:hypothetical protein